MSTTAGSFAVPVAPDLNKEVQSFVAAIPAGTAVAQVVNPTVPVESVTAYNYTSNLLRATVTFTAGINATGAAATRTFLIPPGAVASYDWADEGATDNAIGALGAIDSLSVIAVNAGAATAEASTLAANATSVAGLAYFNFGSS
jgi:hypothetical protein